jgi:cobalamin biosynthesis protein CbiG
VLAERAGNGPWRIAAPAQRRPSPRAKSRPNMSSLLSKPLSSISPLSSTSLDTGIVAAPGSLFLGIGCRRGVSVDNIETAVRAALGARSICLVKRVATLASKANEPALTEFCARYSLPLVAFSSDAINACVQANDTLTRSPAAREHVHVDGVCEPCALLAAPGGILIATKLALDGVTVAIAATSSPPR